MLHISHILQISARPRWTGSVCLQRDQLGRNAGVQRNDVPRFGWICWISLLRGAHKNAAHSNDVDIQIPPYSSFSSSIALYYSIYIILMSYMSSQTGENKRTNKNQLNPITKIHQTHPNTSKHDAPKPLEITLRDPTSPDFLQLWTFQVANVLVIAEASDVVCVILFRMQSISYSILKCYIICICILYRL